MINAAGPMVPTGLLLPEAVLHSAVMDTLTAFVAVNAVMFAALALAKVLPKAYLNDWVRRRNERSESRSIHPDQPTREQARRRGSKIRRSEGTTRLGWKRDETGSAP